jgi:hypothetical protein
MDDTTTALKRIDKALFIRVVNVLLKKKYQLLRIEYCKMTLFKILMA